MSALSSHKTLLLVGAGHAHLEVLRQFKEQGAPMGWQVILVSPDRYTYYSGMLSGYLIGLYSLEEIRFDLVSWLSRSPIRWHSAEANSLDLQSRKLKLSNGETIQFDLLSIDVGSRPKTFEVLSSRVFSVKPIADFLVEWSRMIEELKAWSQPSNPRVTIVGGGASGVELALALASTVQKFRSRPVISLWDKHNLLSGWPARAGRLARRELERLGVKLRLGIEIESIKVNEIFYRSLLDRSREGGGRGNVGSGQEATDFVVLATQAVSGHNLFREAQLETDEAGFLKVNSNLQSLSHDFVFASGDCASLETPVAKAGVYAVRQGPILAKNLRLKMSAKGSLISYQPQTNFMILLTLGRRSAIFAKGPFAFAGPLLWQLKDRIDRSFVKRYR